MNARTEERQLKESNGPQWSSAQEQGSKCLSVTVSSDLKDATVLGTTFCGYAAMD